MEKVKYNYLDAARGLALLLVMISHAHGLSSFLIFYYIQVFFIISGVIKYYYQNDFNV